jgi:DNA-3-methyladenine glycosylase I
VVELRTGTDGVVRCGWCGDDPLYVRYHDTEWGHRLTDPVRLFEKMCLEGFQSGLAWITILRKRESFRAAFEGFVPEVVAGYGEADVQRLLADAGIVRHRGKIESTINNARRVLELDLGLDELVERYRPVSHQRPTSTLPASTAESTALARDLKRRGFSFVGPTTMYAFMQSVGLVNDHLVGCERT